ncbi:hypothetical protein G7Y79_00008g023140 [Physcia stellaris]|nr:hypothetical protein G7Y79_00008g023140 [Physcia stellaris]
MAEQQDTLPEVKIRAFAGLAAAMMKKAKATKASQSSSPSRTSINRCSSEGEAEMLSSNADDDEEEDDKEVEIGIIKTAQSIMKKSGLNSLSDSEDNELPRWTNPNPKKRKRTEEEQKRRKPDGFDYAGMNTRNMAPKIVYPQDRKILNRLTTRAWIGEAKAAGLAETRTYITTDHLGLEDEDDTEFARPFASLYPRVIPKDSMPLKDRKRFFIYTPTAAMEKAMRAHVSEIHQIFAPIEKIDDCMLHPDPPPCRVDGKPIGTIKYNYQWRDVSGVHKITVNYGVIALLINSRLTAAQKEGWIEEAWHLSHLCGNWICCNWRHHTVEDGPTNISRNGCFGSSKECVHNPPCMKDKKQKLLLPANKKTSKQVALPGMTDTNIEVDEESSESGCSINCDCCD